MSTHQICLKRKESEPVLYFATSVYFITLLSGYFSAWNIFHTSLFLHYATALSPNIILATTEQILFLFQTLAQMSLMGSHLQLQVGQQCFLYALVISTLHPLSQGLLQYMVLLISRFIFLLHCKPQEVWASLSYSPFHY